METVNIKINGRIHKCELVEVINKAYGPDKNGNLYVTHSLVTVKLPNGKVVTLVNPNLK